VAIPTFTPSAPDQAMQGAFAPSINKQVFGDGYVQRSGIGINSDFRKYMPTWTNRTQTEANYIIDFLQGQLGYNPFYWTPSGETQQRTFVCEKFKYSWNAGNFCDIQATFEEAPSL
jgi:phage-related protein